MPNTTTAINNLELLIEKADLTSGRIVRYWGSEFEHPRAGMYARKLGSHFLEAKDDSTVSHWGGDNACTCPTCGHSCNCPTCNYRQGGRCSDSQNNEVTMRPYNRAYNADIADYIEHLTETQEDCNAENYADYCNSCGDCIEDQDGYCYDCEQTSYDEDGGMENWGFHTHVDARDLNIRQIGTAVRIATYAMKKWAHVFGADEDTYNMQATDGEITALQNEGTVYGRPAINASGIIRYLNEYREADRQDPSEYPLVSQKATIEFRSFRHTDFSGLHFARVAFARAVVDYAKAGKPAFWLLRENDFGKFLDELEIGKH